MSKYETKLNAAEEAKFKAWKTKHAPKDSGQDYDLRGAFKAGVRPDKTGHWPDTYKKPNHPTFSVESKYAKGKEGESAGTWKKGKFIASDAFKLKDESLNTVSRRKFPAR